MNERFVKRMQDEKVAHDCAVVGDFIRIWCEAHHGDRPRRPAETDGAALGVYSKKHPALCSECESHLAYAEQRRAYCPKDPKPFCAHCDTHCYKPEEREWQRNLMRFAGPRSWREGHMLDGIRHLMEARKWRRDTRRGERQEGTSR